MLISFRLTLINGAEVLFAFKVIEDTNHGTQTHNVDNCFNNGHNVYLLGSESQGLLLLSEVKVFGHFVKERSCLILIEVKDGEGIDPKVE